MTVDERVNDCLYFLFLNQANPFQITVVWQLKRAIFWQKDLVTGTILF